MTLTQLHYLMVIAETNSLNKAAEQLYMSQPSLTSAMKELERELGDRFVRLHRAYLAAADKIEAADWKGNRVRVGGRECLLSRAGKAVLRQKLGGGL